MTDAVVDAAQEAAQRTITGIVTMQLSVEDQRRFAETLLNPPEANEALREAMISHAGNVEVR